MRKVSVFVLMAMCAVLVLAVSSSPASAKEKKSSNLRWHGMLVRISEDGSVLTVRKGNIEKAIHVNDETKWTQTKGKKAEEIQKSDVKEGDDIICLGTADEKGDFVATRVDKRLAK
jgi:maltose-binding protein MalE